MVIAVGSCLYSFMLEVSSKAYKAAKRKAMGDCIDRNQVHGHKGRQATPEAIPTTIQALPQL